MRAYAAVSGGATRVLPGRLAGLAVTATLLTAGLAGVAAAPASAATPLPTAVFAKTSDWGTGFEAGYTITNAMNVPLNSWTLKFTLPATEHVTSLWNGSMTVSGNTITVTNLSWNAPLAPGMTANVGFDASNSGTFTAPAGCTLNGNPCDGSGDTIAPTTPTNLSVLSTTTSAVSLSWTGSTDNLVVSGYNILRGGAVVATSGGTAGTVSGLSPSTTY